MIHLKDIAIKKSDAQILVSVPSMISVIWKLEEGDELVMELTDDTKQIIIRKKVRDEHTGAIPEEYRSDSED